MNLAKFGAAILMLVLFTAAVPLTVAQPQDAPAAAPAAKALSVDDVLKLAKAGLSEDVIISKIRKNAQAFDLSPDQMLQLKTAGVSDKVIQAMLDPTAVSAPAVATASAPDNAFPEESGVYMKKPADTTWSEILPEVVNWKSGGVLKGFATSGIVKKDTNGHIDGKTSKTRVATTTEFLVVMPDGVAITEYQLLHLHQNSDNREFRAMTGGVFHASGGASRDAVDFQSKKVAPHRYLVTLTSVKPGEYGIMPPGAVASQNAAGSTGKLYTFTVVE